MWIAVQGWIQVWTGQQQAQAHAIVDEHLATSGEARGWIFAPPGQSIYLLYAGDIREQALPELMSVVERLALITPEAIDGDVVEGYFLVGHERGESWLWTVRSGVVSVTEAPEPLRWLAQRP